MRAPSKRSSGRLIRKVNTIGAKEPSPRRSETFH
jgi:hypothetical protein